MSEEITFDGAVPMEAPMEYAEPAAYEAPVADAAYAEPAAYEAVAEPAVEAAAPAASDMSFGTEYAVDIVFVIDATGSMGDVIGKTKKMALSFHDDLLRKLEEATPPKNVTQLRIKVIEFRDFYCDGTRALRESPFFELPVEQKKFENFINAINADGGGDEPESALEALALAIKSDWTNEGDKRRHIVIMFTDASPHPLEKHLDSSAKAPAYPANMPKSLSELKALWERQEMSKVAKRFILFAPDHEIWNEIAAEMTQTIYKTSRAGEGLSEFDNNDILEQIVKSV